MKVIVTVETKFEVEVETLVPAIAERAVECNWHSVYG